MRGQHRGSHVAAVLGWRWRQALNVLHRLRLSLAQRGMRGTVQRVALRLRRRPAVDGSLVIHPLETDFRPFDLPEPAAAPEVSVIIPVHGRRAHTVACLRSIARHAPAASHEVIVVDDASPDDSAAALARIGGLRVISHAGNLGFVDSCNDGARQARGHFLLFLNNDTQVTPGWLDALLACMREEPDCGIVGSRLVYPDGRLQEAGGLVHADASAANIGRFEDRDDARFRFRREVDYVSGASLLISRALFDAVGGFSTDYAPGYYEDTDLAFAVRAAGKRVFYEPLSLVVHEEGATGGTDPLGGAKRHQAEHRQRFRDRRAAELARQSPPGTPAARALRRYARGRMLVIDADLPEPSRDSASLRMLEILRLLHGMRWQVALAAEHAAPDADALDRLGALGVEVVPDALHAWLRRHGEDLDAVMLCRVGPASTLLPLVRRLAPRARILFDTVDVHHLREARAAELADDDGARRRAEATRRAELALVAACDVTLVVSPVERDLLLEAVPGARIEVLSNIHVVHGRHGDFDARRDLVFLGGFGHPPNADAVRWMVADILPRIHARTPGIRLHVLGDVPEAQRRALQGPHVVLHGRIRDLTPFMDGCRVSVAPLRFGAGVKGKVGMAMSHGLPVVATSVAAEGMHLVDGRDVRIADDAEAFAAAVLEVHDDPVLWQRLSDGGLDGVRRHFSPASAAAVLERVLDGATLSSTPPNG